MMSLLLDLLHETCVVYKNMERQRYGNNVKIPLLGHFRQSKAPAFEALFKMHFELLKPLYAVTSFSSPEDELKHQHKIIAQENILAEALLKFTLTPAAESVVTDIAAAEEKKEAPENAVPSAAERHCSDLVCDILKINAQVQLETLPTKAAAEKLQVLEIDFVKKFENVSGADFYLHKAQQCILGIAKHRENILLQQRLLDAELICAKQSSQAATLETHITQLEKEILTLKAKIFPVSACTEPTDLETLKETLRKHQIEAGTRIRGLEAENATLRFQLHNRPMPPKLTDSDARSTAAIGAVSTSRVAFPNSTLRNHKLMLFTHPASLQTAPTEPSESNLLTSFMRFVSGNNTNQQ